MAAAGAFAPAIVEAPPTSMWKFRRPLSLTSWRISLRAVWDMKTRLSRVELVRHSVPGLSPVRPPCWNRRRGHLVTAVSDFPPPSMPRKLCGRGFYRLGQPNSYGHFYLSAMGRHAEAMAIFERMIKKNLPRRRWNAAIGLNNAGPVPAQTLGFRRHPGAGLMRLPCHRAELLSSRATWRSEALMGLQKERFGATAGFFSGRAAWRGSGPHCYARARIRSGPYRHMPRPIQTNWVLAYRMRFTKREPEASDYRHSPGTAIGSAQIRCPCREHAWKSARRELAVASNAAMPPLCLFFACRPRASGRSGWKTWQGTAIHPFTSCRRLAKVRKSTWNPSAGASHHRRAR